LRVADSSKRLAFHPTDSNVARLGTESTSKFIICDFRGNPI
jgi:hypothetical protein